MEFSHDGQIVLNIALHAVGNLELGDDEVRFNARFGGVPRQVSVPMALLCRRFMRVRTAQVVYSNRRLPTQ